MSHPYAKTAEGLEDNFAIKYVRDVRLSGEMR